MTENKTKATAADVDTFLGTIADDQRRSDARLLVGLMSEVTGEDPVLWGTAIVGFGSHHYRHESGREGDIAAVGFSPRKAQSVLYLTGDLADYDDLLARLGKHKVSKSCLYLTRVDQADQQALREIVDRSFRAASA